MEQWTAPFGGAPPISPAQECARAVLVFFYGLVLFFLAGRRAFARWSALDIVVAFVSQAVRRSPIAEAPKVIAREMERAKGFEPLTLTLAR